MTDRLSVAQERALRLLLNGGALMPDGAPASTWAYFGQPRDIRHAAEDRTVRALKRRGLIEFRPTPDDRMSHPEYIISDAGRAALA